MGVDDRLRAIEETEKVNGTLVTGRCSDQGAKPVHRSSRLGSTTMIPLSSSLFGSVYEEVAGPLFRLRAYTQVE